jgi:hypothetical protein
MALSIICNDYSWFEDFVYQLQQKLQQELGYKFCNYKQNFNLGGIKFNYYETKIFIILIHITNFYNYSLHIHQRGKYFSGGNLSFKPQINMFRKLRDILDIIPNIANYIDDKIINQQYTISDVERLHLIIEELLLYPEMHNMHQENTDIIVNYLDIEIRLYLVGNLYGMRININTSRLTGFGIISKSYSALIANMIELVKRCKRMY